MSDVSEDFDRMFKELTDPEEREKARNLTERAARIAARRDDTGL